MFLALINQLTLIQRILLSIAIACFTAVGFLSLPPMPVSVHAPVFHSDTVSEKAMSLAKTIHQIQQTATAKSLQLGLHLTPAGYAFMIRDIASTQDNAWQPFQIQGLATTGTFEKTTQLDFSLLGEQQNDEEERLGRSQPLWFDLDQPLKDATPQIIFLPDGEITPFTLTLLDTTQQSESRQIEVSVDGQISVIPIKVSTPQTSPSTPQKLTTSQ